MKMIKKSSKDLGKIILYSLITVMCFVLLILTKQISMLIFAIIFGLLAFIQKKQYTKHIEGEEKLEEVFEKINGFDNNSPFMNTRKDKKKDKEKKKDIYENFVSNVENKLGDFDVEDYLNEDDK